MLLPDGFDVHEFHHHAKQLLVWKMRRKARNICQRRYPLFVDVLMSYYECEMQRQRLSLSDMQYAEALAFAYLLRLPQEFLAKAEEECIDFAKREGMDCPSDIEDWTPPCAWDTVVRFASSVDADADVAFFDVIHEFVFTHTRERTQQQVSLESIGILLLAVFFVRRNVHDNISELIEASYRSTR